MSYSCGHNERTYVTIYFFILEMYRLCLENVSCIVDDFQGYREKQMQPGKK